MITLTEELVDALDEKFLNHVNEKLRPTGRAIGRRQTSNIELVKMFAELMPISDELVLPTREKITDRIWPGEFFSLEQICAAKCNVHQWYACLSEQAKRSGLNLPHLNEQVVETTVAQCPTWGDDTGLGDYDAEKAQIKAFTDLIMIGVGREANLDDPVEKDKANEQINYYAVPLIILTRIINLS